MYTRLCLNGGLVQTVEFLLQLTSYDVRNWPRRGCRIEDATFTDSEIGAHCDGQCFWTCKILVFLGESQRRSVSRWLNWAFYCRRTESEFGVSLTLSNSTIPFLKRGFCLLKVCYFCLERVRVSKVHSQADRTGVANCLTSGQSTDSPHPVTKEFTH